MKLFSGNREGSETDLPELAAPQLKGLAQGGRRRKSHGKGVSAN